MCAILITFPASAVDYIVIISPYAANQEKTWIVLDGDMRWTQISIVGVDPIVKERVLDALTWQRGPSYRRRMESNTSESRHFQGNIHQSTKNKVA